MGITYLILIIFQVVSVAAIATLWVKITKIQNQEDQRLSKGLQLLQSKLAVLEDLSDRTEVQVNQLVAILEGKIKDIQAKLIDADKVIGKIEKNISRSLEVANIFQDKIPHQEILERQYTKKYVKAAQLAHAGKSVEEIAKFVDLTSGEIELIVKLNRDHLQFEISELPEWAKGVQEDLTGGEMELSVSTIYESRSEATNPLRNLESAFEVPIVDNQNLKKLGDQFRTAMASQPMVPTPATSSTEGAQPVASKKETTSASTGAFTRRVPEINSQLLNTFSQFFDTTPEVVEAPPKKEPEQVFVQGGKKMMVVKPFQFKVINDEINP